MKVVNIFNSGMVSPMVPAKNAILRVRKQMKSPDIFKPVSPKENYFVCISLLREGKGLFIGPVKPRGEKHTEYKVEHLRLPSTVEGREYVELNVFEGEYSPKPLSFRSSGEMPFNKNIQPKYTRSTGILHWLNVVSKVVSLPPAPIPKAKPNQYLTWGRKPGEMTDNVPAEKYEYSPSRRGRKARLAPSKLTEEQVKKHTEETRKRLALILEREKQLQRVTHDSFLGRTVYMPEKQKQVYIGKRAKKAVTSPIGATYSAKSPWDKIEISKGTRTVARESTDWISPSQFLPTIQAGGETARKRGEKGSTGTQTAKREKEQRKKGKDILIHHETPKRLDPNSYLCEISPLDIVTVNERGERVILDMRVAYAREQTRREKGKKSESKVSERAQKTPKPEKVSTGKKVEF